MTWVMWNLTSFFLETVLLQCRIGARFAPNIPSAQKMFWTHPMILLDHEAQVKALSVLGIVLILSKIGARFASNIP
jgi:hypothetical protein